jgi:hypothetical protein
MTATTQGVIRWIYWKEYELYESELYALILRKSNLAVHLQHQLGAG